MIALNPTRTNLLILKDRALSVLNSINILKARRQALIREFLSAVAPLLKSREELRRIYARAIQELRLSLGHEGENFIDSVTAVTKREFGVDIAERNIMGLRYRDVIIHETAVRSPDERGYDFFSSTPHLDETIYAFEFIAETMLEIAAFESKLKRLGAEILRITRRIRVLEERILPNMKQQIKGIAHYIGEREREAYYRLKIKKGGRLYRRQT